MGGLTGKERTAVVILAVLVLGAAAYSADCLLAGGILAWAMGQEEYLAMAAETAALFGLLVMVFRFSPSFLAGIAGAGVLAAVFLWAHQVFAPVVVSGLYGAYVWGLGRWFLNKVQGKGAERAGAWREFLVGCLLVVCCFCLMSALGAGRILYLWIFVLVTGGAVGADRWIHRDKGNGDWKRKLQEGAEYGKARRGLGKACLWAGVAAFFCIQAGRMNIAVDFDSLWYGVRSPYILDNGRGIYENMGNIGIVYTYSKGFEVLTLPLSVLPSYSFAIAFNLWLAAGGLWLCRKIAGICAGGEGRGMLVCLLASLPGIMNMGITAKSDIATLYTQLALFYEMLLYLNGDRQALWYGLGACLFSWTLKPTALVFSTAIAGMSMVFFVWKKVFAKQRHGRGQRQAGGTGTRKEIREGAGGCAAFVLSLLALTGIWARTFLITGLPVTSVFSSILTRLGFKMKYPFNTQKIPNSSAGITRAQWLKDMAKRVWGVLFNPQGPDMDHVILAWGSLAVWYLLCLCLVWVFLDKRERTGREKETDWYLHTVFVPFFGCCLVSLVMLTQVDGNYFMLFYVLFAIYGFRLMERLENRKAAAALRRLSVPVIIFSAVIMSLTNWGWAVGFTPVSWKHKGYYNHQALQHLQMAEKGNRQIWDILEENPRNRLIAIGEHPQVLAFPCNAQSYADITGTWGNVALVKYMDNFVEFMRYGKTDYVYAQAGYISEDERAWSLTCDLIEYGVLVPVCFEQGNMLAQVNTEGERTEESVKYLEEFLEQYERKG